MARYRDRLLASAQVEQVEQRVIGGVPWRPWDSFATGGYFNAGGPAHPSRQYMGPDAALGLPSLYAGVKLIADNISSMPLRTYIQTSGGVGRPDGYTGKRMWTGPTLFDEPSYDTTLYEWVNMMMCSLLLQGNAWGFVTGRDAYGFPTGIQWLPPQDVYVHEAPDENTWNPLAAKVFMFGREVQWHGPDAEVFHMRGMPMAGRLQGVSPLMQFALLFTSGTEAMRFGNDWFASGGFPPGTFQNAEIEVDADQAASMRARLVHSLRAHEPLVYGRDWDYKPVTVPPAEAQFLEAIQMNATQVAAILNLPPDRIGGSRGDSLTYNTTEQSTLQIIEGCRPWLVNAEQRFSLKLLPRSRFSRFYTDALLKTDLEARMSMYQVMRNIGLRNINEIRDLEDLPAVPGDIGNEYLPLTTMNAMGTRAGAIPKSFMKSVVLEMDVATDRLIKLEKYIIPSLVKQGYPVQGTAPAPGAGGFGGGSSPASPGSPSGGSPGTNQATGNPGQVTVHGQTGTPIGKPNAPLPLAQDPASFLASLISVQRNADVPYEVRLSAQNMLVSIAQREDRIRQLEPGINDDEGAHEGIVPGLTTYMPDAKLARDMIEDTQKGRGHL